MDFLKKSLEEHKKKRGKIEIKSKFKIRNKNDLSVAYTPGVAEPCLVISKKKEKVYDYVAIKNMVAVITDGSAVLGLGNIGPEASLPVMEGKAVLFKKFGDVDAIPLALNTNDVDKFVETVKLLSPTLGGVNLEDISAPRCFEIEKKLKEELDIPVFHDDQHGTAIVVLAGLINSLKVVKKKKDKIKVVINGAGAAGIAITKLLYEFGIRDLILCDSKGIISKYRTDLNPYKKEILKITNKNNINGNLHDALNSADVFIGVSKGNLLTAKDVQNMNKNSIIFAMANPVPEIKKDIALKNGALIYASGRSDCKNQLNNVLVFPGIFKGALKAKTQITEEMKIEAGKVLASIVKKPSKNKIIPSVFEKGIADKIANKIILLSKKK